VVTGKREVGSVRCVFRRRTRWWYIFFGELNVQKSYMHKDIMKLHLETISKVLTRGAQYFSIIYWLPW